MLAICVRIPLLINQMQVYTVITVVKCIIIIVIINSNFKQKCHKAAKQQSSERVESHGDFRIMKQRR